MLQNTIAIKLAAMAAALGLNTAEWQSPSKQMEEQVGKLEAALKNIGEKGNADKLQADLNSATQEIKGLADKGDKDAQFAMGLFLQQSNQQGSLEQAVEYYKKAAAQGQLQALNNLGFITAASTRDPEKAKEGIAMIKKASDGKLNAARRNMAQIYLNGMAGEKRSPEEAKKLLEAAWADKDADAGYLLSQLHLGGGGKEYLDEKKGFDLLKASAAAGNANALDTLGTLYLQGGKVGSIEVKADPKAAVEQFEALAKAGNAVGLRKMGGVYEAGIDGVVAKDFKKAFESYAAAAKGNDALAQFRLASMFDTGYKADPKSDKVDVAPDAAQALSLYKLAVQGNIPAAAYNVGVFYETGRAVDRDLQKAFGFFQAAAQAGVAPAMQKVGDFYLNGAGTIKDPVAAGGWYLRAAVNGSAEGWLSYGAVTEAGAVASQSPALDAAQAYKNAYQLAAVQTQLAMDAKQQHGGSDAVALASYIRLGSLYARGFLVAKGEAPKPDLERAYAFFQQAVDLSDGKNQLAVAARDEILKQDPSVKTKGDADIKTMKAELQKFVEDTIANAKKAQAGGAAAATPAATPVAEDAPKAPKADEKKTKGKK